MESCEAPESTTGICPACQEEINLRPIPMPRSHYQRIALWFFVFGAIIGQPWGWAAFCDMNSISKEYSGWFILGGLLTAFGLGYVALSMPKVRFFDCSNCGKKNAIQQEVTRLKYKKKRNVIIASSPKKLKVGESRIPSNTKQALPKKKQSRLKNKIYLRGGRISDYLKRSKVSYLGFPVIIYTMLIILACTTFICLSGISFYNFFPDLTELGMGCKGEAPKLSDWPLIILCFIGNLCLCLGPGLIYCLLALKWSTVKTGWRVKVMHKVVAAKAGQKKPETSDAIKTEHANNECQSYKKTCPSCLTEINLRLLPVASYSRSFYALIAFSFLGSIIWISLLVYHYSFVAQGLLSLILCGLVYFLPGFVLMFIATKLAKVRYINCSHCDWEAQITQE